jgi:hypothetical protein
MDLLKFTMEKSEIQGSSVNVISHKLNLLPGFTPKPPKGGLSFAKFKNHLSFPGSVTGFKDEILYKTVLEVEEETKVLLGGFRGETLKMTILGLTSFYRRTEHGQKPALSLPQRVVPT